jgi:single-strand DNA-binding protein
MSRGLNKVMVIGNLGRDPEMRYTPFGRPVTTFSVATTRNWSAADGQKRSETEWFNIVAWGSLAEICNQYLKRASRFTSKAACRPAVGKTSKVTNAAQLKL